MKQTCLAILLLLSFAVAAQQKPGTLDTIYKVRLKGGSMIKGKIISNQNGKMVLQSPSYGSVTVLADSIKRVVPDENYLNRQRKWYTYPGSTHYLIAASAIQMKRGEVELQVAELFFTKVNVALSNNISIGAGVDWTMPTMGEDGYDEGPLPMVDIKGGVKITKWLHLGAQAFVSRAPNTMNDDYPDEYEALFMGFGIATVGNENNNVSAGIGYNYQNRFHASGPTYTLSGMCRISPRLSIISETWIFPAPNNSGYFFQPPVTGYPYEYSDYGPVYNNNFYAPVYYFITGYGIRLTAKKVAVDVAFANNQNIFKNSFIGYPYISCSINLAR